MVCKSVIVVYATDEKKVLQLYRINLKYGKICNEAVIIEKITRDWVIMEPDAKPSCTLSRLLHGPTLNKPKT